MAGSVNPLHDAAKSDRAEEVRALVEAGADMQARDADFGWSALHVAAGNGALGAARELLCLGSPLDAEAKDGEVPLHLAAAEGYTALVGLLAEAKANVNAANGDGETPLHVAVQHVGSKPLGHVRKLLEFGADPSLKDANGHDAFETAGVYTNRAEEVRAALAGEPAKAADPDDPWPETPGELTEGTDPLLVAESLRELGNSRFRAGLHEQALASYLKAKLFLPTWLAQYEAIAEGDERGARARTCALAASGNAAMCKLKLKDYEACVNMCDGILRMDPMNVKAFYRKALALRAQGDDAGAEAELRAAADGVRVASLEADDASVIASLEAEGAAIQKELADIARQRRREKGQEKRLAQKMFG